MLPAMRSMLFTLALAALATACSKSSAPASPSNGGGGAADPAAQRAAFDALASFLAGGAADPVRALFVEDAVSFEEACSVCDPDDPETASGPETVKGSELVETLAQRARAAAAEDGIGGFVVGDNVACADDCCTVSYDEGISHSYVFLDRVCFAPGTTQIVKLEFTNGG